VAIEDRPADGATRSGRDVIRKRLDNTQNVYLAARSRLSDARSDADTNLSSLRSGLEQLLRDLRNAYDAAEAVVRRRPPTELGRDRISPS
jgi:hypothetical protein